MRDALPPRLRDDTGLGAAFADLDEVLEGYDLEALRPPVAPPPGPPPRASFRWAAAAGLGAAAAVVLAWWLWPRDPAPALPGEAVEAVEPAEADAHRDPRPPVAHAPGDAPNDRAELSDPEPDRARPAVAEPAPEPIADPPPAPTADLPPAPTVDGAVAQPGATSAPSGTPASTAYGAAQSGTLAEEQAMIDRAGALVQEGRHAEALEAVAAYERAFAEPRLGTSADLIRLEALIGASRWAEVEALAAELSRLSAFAARADYLRGLRARALVALGRCGEALDVIADLPRRDTKDIRAACD